MSRSEEMAELDKKAVSVTDVTPSLPPDEERKEKVSGRRATTHVPRVVVNVKFQKLVKWWLKPSVIIA